MLVAIGIMAFFAGSAPALKCDIAMENWCIVQLPSSVSMKDAPRSREWTVSLSKDVSESKIRIIEDKFCDGILSYKPNQNSDEEFQILSTDNCGIHISVLKKEPAVASRALVERLILLRKTGDWVPLEL
jgi:hypothetical protein